MAVKGKSTQYTRRVSPSERKSETQSATPAWHEHLLEAGWLTAAVVPVLLFNYYSPRIFVTGKTTFIHFVAAFMLLVWLVQRGARLARPTKTPAPAEITIQWPGLRQVVTPLGLAFGLGLVYVLSTLLSVNPSVSFWGSYSRLEGTLTILSCIVIFALTATHLKRFAQVQRLMTAILMTSWPVCLYSLAEQAGLEPWRWTGVEREGITSMLGHPAYLGSYLTMVIPLALGQLLLTSRTIVAKRGANRWDVVLAANLAVLLVLQVATLVFTQSRGPVLGLAIALFVILLIWAAYGRQKLIFPVLIAGLEVVLLVVLLNLPNTPLPGLQQAIRQMPHVGRISRIFDTTGTGGFRLALWNSAATMMEAHPERLPLGFGPEMLSNILLPYAVPTTENNFNRVPADRAHNITFDILSTTGLAGLIVYLGLFIALVVSGLEMLRIIDSARTRRTCVAAMLLALGAGALIPRVVTGNWALSGLGVPLGLVIGLLVYLVTRIIRPTSKPDLPYHILVPVATVLAAMVGHLVDISFAFNFPVTQLYFWLFAAVLARLQWAQQRDEAPIEERVPRLSLGVVLALIVITLLFDFVDPFGSGSNPGQAYVALGLIVLTFIGSGVMLLASTVEPRRARPSLLGSSWVLSLLLVFLTLVYWVLGVSLSAGVPGDGLLVYFLLYHGLGVVLLMTLLAWSLATSSSPGARFRLPQSLLLPGLATLAGLGIMLVVTRPLQADFASKLGLSVTTAGQWDQGLQYYGQAIDLAPRESFYYQSQAYVFQQKARATPDPAARENVFQQGVPFLDKARTLEPLNPDPIRGTAAYYLAWARATQNSNLRSNRANTALMYCLQDAQMTSHPDSHIVCGSIYEFLGQYDRAVAEYQRALQIDPTLLRAYADIGRSYAQQGKAKEALAAYQAGLARNPGLREARLGLVNLYQQQGDLQMALAEARTAVEQNPADFDSHRALVDVYRKLGQVQDALKEATVAQDLAPADQRAAIAKLIDDLKAQQ